MTDRTSGGLTRLSRRSFLGLAASSAAAGLVEWAPAFRVPAGAQSDVPSPPGFPSSLPLYRQGFVNWSGEIAVDQMWTTAPATAEEVVVAVNWAHVNGYRLRVRGMGHNWSPLVVGRGAASSKILLADMTTHMASVTVDAASSPPRATAQAGATMESLLTALEASGCGMVSSPAPGDITIGGVLAIDGHGSAVPALGEQGAGAYRYGSVSNLVLSVDAVVWDPSCRRYVLRSFDRGQRECRVLMTSLGRGVVTAATLAVGPNTRLQCESRLDVPASALFAAPDSAGSDSLAAHIDRTGRVEAIWFPFTETPWLKVWSVAPSKPASSREVTSPYNYTFADKVPPELSVQLSNMVRSNPASTPAFGELALATVKEGLASTGTSDIWGWSKNVLLYVQPTTLRVTANGYAVLTSRSNIQRVVHDFVGYYESRVSLYRRKGQYPMNGPIEIRATGLDQPVEANGSASEAAPLSALRPRPDHRDWDVAVWLDILTFPGTPHAADFYRDIESWMFRHYSGSYAAVRPEWSKGWAYTSKGAWTDSSVIDRVVPSAYRAGQPAGDGWDAAVSTLNSLDPHRVFTNRLLGQLLVS